MPRKKTVATTAETADVNGNADSGRSLRKRVAKAATIASQDEDEPVVKKRGNQPAKKESKRLINIKKEMDDSEDEVQKNGKNKQAVAEKGKKKKEASVKVEVKQEAEEEDEDAATAGPSQPTSKKGAKSKVKTEDASEDASPALGKAPGGIKTGSRKKKGSRADGEENIDTNNLPKPKTAKERVVVKKGRAAVDALCPIAKSSHVFEEEDDIWDCMLNQTNIQFNNNKYYLIQLLKDDEREAYSVWMRWGRVGNNGQNSLQPCGSSIEKAKKIFEKKFSDKTKNDWDERESFEKVPGKYDLLKMDYDAEDTPDTSKAFQEKDNAIKERKKVESNLEIRVKALVELICDIKTMEEAVVEMKYDAQKAPLGKLTTDQIKAGYLALKDIDNLITSGKYKNMDLVHACNAFYTRIPHYFGMKVPPLIRTKVELREKIALLEALGDIQAALSVIDQPIDTNIHPVDQQYKALQCDISPLGEDSSDYKLIKKYLETTHGKTHTNYSLELLEVFTCKKDVEYERFKDVGNKMLLWHGSRLSNWAGILSQGLRIAPPEAPVTGYMFGKGIYFADMASKSANYCCPSLRNNIGFVVLSEVALGKTNDLLDADYYAHKLPKGCNSVKGCGKIAPNIKNMAKLSDGTLVPMGPGQNTGVNNSKGYTLMYNEFIVYDPAQVRTRYLLKLKFKFNIF